MIVSQQLLGLLAMLATGVLATAAIDAVRTAAGGTRAGTVLELAAWLLLGIAAYGVLFAVRDGEWRFYDLLAQLSGLLLYESVFCRPFRLAGRLIRLLLLRPAYLILRGVFRTILFIIGIPLRLIRFVLKLLLRPFRRPYRAVRHRLGAKARKIRKRLPRNPLKKPTI
ncbi:spore cortex biosynthesis protein YabQ [Bhargavaea ullalensis]|uniref:Spore cortex protein YabQ (Spore_YabQ) n=1 Tax=Bhargavaea ullalensis TaxID=1265685 RepID=A0ABV2GD59_9BACL